MLTVTIRKITAQYTLNDEEYNWIRMHLNRPMQVFSVHFSYVTGMPWDIAVYTGNHVITLFVDENGLEYEFGGTLQ